MEHDARIVHQDIQLRIASLHALGKGYDLRRIRNVTLDDLVSQFEKLKRKSEANTCRASRNQDGATGEFHTQSFQVKVANGTPRLGGPGSRYEGKQRAKARRK